MKKIITILLSLTLILSLMACGTEKTTSTGTNNENSVVENTENTQKTEETADNSELYADAINFTIELENGGIMKGELYPNLAPVTVENFVKLVKDDFYDGLIFHRVIEGFMIQGGGYDKDMNPKESASIKGEFASNGFKNDLKHTKGVISMARTSVPDSASSQFFIMHEDAPHLDGEYAAFGRITEGLDIIDEVATCETTVYQKYGMTDFPADPIIIKTISIN